MLAGNASKAGSGIFPTCRREDAAGWAGRLAADLQREFPGNHAFRDVASIEIGGDFPEATRTAQRAGDRRRAQGERCREAGRSAYDNQVGQRSADGFRACLRSG
jgi:hypothetical protein